MFLRGARFSLKLQQVNSNQRSLGPLRNGVASFTSTAYRNQVVQVELNKEVEEKLETEKIKVNK